MHHMLSFFSNVELNYKTVCVSDALPITSASSHDHACEYAFSMKVLYILLFLEHILDDTLIFICTGRIWC